MERRNTQFVAAIVDIHGTSRYSYRLA